MSRGSHPVDPGLQAERTLLAWRRTCLALVVGHAALFHVLPDRFGEVAVVAGLAGITSVAVTWTLPHVRYLRWRPHLTEEPTGLRIGGLPMAAMTLAVVLGGVFAMAAVLVH